MLNNRESFYDSAIIKVVELKKIKPELENILNFWVAILNAQQEVVLSFQPNISVINLKSCRERNFQGLSFLNFEDIQINQVLLGLFLEKIIEIIQSRGEKIVPLKLKEKFLIKYSFILHGLLSNGIMLEKFAEELKMEVNLFYFFTQQVFSPFLKCYSQILKEQIDFNAWVKGVCPICGQEPMMARLEKENGSKWLFCSLCYSEWLFKRLECPFCGNDNQETLHYFYVEDEEKHRVDVCDKCRRYHKIVDARKSIQKINLWVENLDTLVFDIMAKKEGYLAGKYFFI